MGRLPRFVVAWLAAGLLGLGAAGVHAEDEPAKPDGIAWFASLAEARAVAAKTGRPIFVAMHVRPRVASPAATERTRRWLSAYAAPELVALSRELACVLRVTSSPEGRDPDVDEGAPAAVHLVLDGESRVLARLDARVPPMPGVLGRLLRRGLRAHGPIPADAARIDKRLVSRAERRIEGMSPMKPVGVPTDAPGVRLRLRWELPAPKLPAGGPAQVKARVLMRWDDTGPYLVGSLAIAPGEEIDVPIDIRFDAFEGLAALATEGLHRVDLYLEPDIGSFSFSKGPLHVGRVWIELGDGGGGGGGGGGESESPEPEPDPEKEDDEQPAPVPDGNPLETPTGPDDAQDDVIDPFVGEGETVKKDDAIVAVEDEDAGLKPPEQVPLDKALRDFEKEREKAIRADGISPRERAFLRRYFELLQKHAREKGGAPSKRAPKAPK